MNCPNCTQALKPQKRFCTNCGTAVFVRQCNNCNALNEADDNFCGDCGLTLPAPTTIIRPTTRFQLERAPTKAAKPIAHHDNERRFVTVLFADLVGFTNFSTQADPEEVSRLVRNLVEIFEPEITSRGGVVDKYEGDAVLARFGAPVAHEDDAEQAMMAALALHRRVVELNLKHKRPDGQPFQLRIGLNTGEVIAGTIDPSGKDYTILGDVVNTSQRLQTAALPGQTVVGELTYRLTRNSFDFESLGTIALKGKPKPARAYGLTGLKAVLGDGRGMEMNADAGPRAGETNFVGRNNELEMLGRAFAEAEAGHGQMVMVSGETGIGKSRLVRHFLQNRGATRLVVGRAFSFTTESPYALLRNILIHILGLHPSETLVQPAETRQRLADLGLRTGLTDGFEDALELALLADALGLPDDDNLLSKLDTQTRGLTLQRTIKELLCGLSRLPAKTGQLDQPLVVLFEDMHWADKPSAEAVELLAESLSDFPLLLVVTSRPEWHQPSQWLKLNYFQHIQLRPLSGKERARMLHYTLHQAGLDLPAETEQEILERSGGNPFFVEEMIAALKEASAEDAEEALQVPATIHELLLSRIDRLDFDTKKMLQIGAVLGRRFPERLLRWVAGQVLDVENHHVDSGLQHLKRQDLLLENKLAQELEYFFKHGMMQEVAYGIMLTERRQELHGLVGAALEELYLGREEEVVGLLAYHYSRGKNQDKALTYLTRAAERAVTFNAYADARRYYQSALEIAPAEVQVDLLLRLEELKIQLLETT